MSKREDSLKRIIGILILSVSLFVIGFTSGRFIGSDQIIDLKKDSEADVDFDLFWDIWSTLKNDYVDDESVDEQTMLYGSIKGMVESIGDPATVFLDPEETDEFNLSSEGKYFEGIGAELGYDDGAVIIVAPLEGSPAKESGLRSGDIILKVDDYEITSTDSVYDVVALIRGEAGTIVTLQVLHNGDYEPVDIEIERKEITVPSMSWELVGEDNNIALINLDRFTDSSFTAWSNSWDTLAGEVAESGVNKIILDLRSNPGGYFDAALYAADDFLEDGVIIAQQKDKDGDLDVFKASSGGKLLDQKLVVLVDSGSASASEILAGALEQNDRAELIGEQTYGKGTAQTVLDFYDGSSLHLTILQWLLPDGTSLNRDNPISPDIEVEYTNEDFLNGDDPRLDKAIDMLSK